MQFSRFRRFEQHALLCMYIVNIRKFISHIQFKKGSKQHAALRVIYTIDNVKTPPYADKRLKIRSPGGAIIRV